MITYVTGDATNPIGEGRKMIIHVCNNRHGWGAGFVLALSRRSPIPEEYYRRTALLSLGDVQFVTVNDNLIVANMIAQTLGGPAGVPPLKYGELRKCLRKVKRAAITLGCSIHAPRFGAGLAGGKWETIETMINEELNNNEELSNIDIFIYDLKQ